ncbi:MAG: putative metalloprotease CJM1_0395 family protein [Chloroflexota bacterium]
MNEISALDPKAYLNESAAASDLQKHWTDWLSAYSRRPASASSSSNPQKDEVSLSGTAQQKQEESQDRSISGQRELSEQEKQKVSQLKETDRKVRAHEQAHVRAGGDLIRGMAQFTYDVGPDNKRYAVAGEVSIDTSPVEGDPEATLRKAGRIKKAALAPADPSPQDRAVAAEADAMAMRARLELTRAQQNQTSPPSGRVVNIQI